jgi:hypothetical protein
LDIIVTDELGVTDLFRAALNTDNCKEWVEMELKI